MKLFLVANSRAKKFKKDERHWKTLQATCAQHPHYFLKSLDDLDKAVDQLLLEKPDVLVVAGGDGTLRTTLSRLIKKAEGRELPKVLALPGGTINLVTQSLGMKNKFLFYLNKAVNPYASWQEKKIRLLNVSGEQGFVFGVGAFPAFIEQYEAGTEPNAWKAFKMLSAMVVQLTMGLKSLDHFFPQFAVNVTRNHSGHVLLNGLRAWSASAVPDIGFRLKPYVKTSADHFAILMLKKDFQGFFSSLPKLYRGEKVETPFTSQSEAAHISLEFDKPMPWVIDGDLMPAQKRLEVSLDREVTFVIPS